MRGYSRYGGLKLAFSLCRRAGGRASIAIAATETLSGLALGAQLLLAQQLVGAATQRGAVSFLHVAGLLSSLVAAALCGSVAKITADAQRLVLSELVEHEATLNVISAIGRAELVDFDEPSFVDLVERTRGQGNLRAIQLVNACSGITGAVAAGVSVSVSLAVASPTLLAFAALSVLPTFYAARLNNAVYFHYITDTTVDHREREYFARILTERRAAAELGIFGARGFFTARYVAAQDRQAAALRRAVAASYRRSIAGAAVTVFITGASLALAVWQFAAGQIELASAAVAVIAFVQLRGTLEGLTFQFAQVHEAALFLQDFLVLDRWRTDARPRVKLMQPLEVLTVEAVRFRYARSSEPVLRDASFTLRVGELVAIVGPNGSGKSTLVKLLTGLIEPQSGRLLADGQPWRPGPEDVTALLQEPGRYWLSTRENVELARPLPDRIDDIRGALTAAGAPDQAARLDAMLGPEIGGGDLSAGQWQKVGLARALLRPARLLVLDEPSSAADHLSEQELARTLRAAAADRCVVMVTHRPELAASCDRVVHLLGGEVVATGTHATLMATDDDYSALMSTAETSPSHLYTRPGVRP